MIRRHFDAKYFNNLFEPGIRTTTVSDKLNAIEYALMRQNLNYPNPTARFGEHFGASV